MCRTAEKAVSPANSTATVAFKCHQKHHAWLCLERVSVVDRQCIRPLADYRQGAGPTCIELHISKHTMRPLAKKKAEVLTVLVIIDKRSYTPAKRQNVRTKTPTAADCQ